MTAAAGTLVSEETPERSWLFPVEKRAAFQIGLYFGALTLAARGLAIPTSYCGCQSNFG